MATAKKKPGTRNRPITSHTWIWISLLVIMLVGVPASATTLVLNPDVDGIVTRTAENSTWTSIISGNGTTAATTGASPDILQVYTSATVMTDNITTNQRAIFIYNTSSLPDTATIISATHKVYGFEKTGGIGSAGLLLINGSTTSNTGLVAGDYQLKGNTALSSVVPYVDQTASGALDIPLNTAGKAWINKTGFTVIEFETDWEYNGVFGGTWANSKYYYYGTRMTEYGSNIPSLTIEYTSFVPNFTANATSGTAPLSIQFNDTTSDTPTAWSWDFGDGNTSTLQNATHTYSDCSSTYTVSLNVSNAGGHLTKTKTDYIVTNGCSVDTPASQAFDWIAANLTPGFNISNEGQAPGSSANPFLNKLWLWYYDQRLNSTDGNVWGTTSGQSPLLPIYGSTSAIFGNKVYLLGGDLPTENYYQNTTYISTDGITFTTNTSPWLGRDYAGVFTPPDTTDNKMYIISGRAGYNQFRNDTWSTSDGTNWTNVTPADSSKMFPGRWSSICLKLNGVYWVIAGEGYNESGSPLRLNETWHSTDLINWTLGTRHAAFGGRREATGFVYNNSMWITAGVDGVDTNGNGTWDNIVNYGDTWWSRDGVSWYLANTSTDIIASDWISEQLNGRNYVINSKSRADVWYFPEYIPPVVSFTANTTSGTAPLAIQFTDTSTNTPTGWNWSWGGGNWTNGTEPNPIKTYDFNGVFDAFLIASNAAGSNQSANTTITVSDYTTPAASFSKSRVLVVVPQLLIVNDTSSNTPTTWNWSWGDGQWTNTTDSAARNATHRYSRLGYFPVSLTATNAAGTNTTARQWVFVWVRR